MCCTGRDGGGGGGGGGGSSGGDGSGGGGGQPEEPRVTSLTSFSVRAAAATVRSLVITPEIRCRINWIIKPPFWSLLGLLAGSVAYENERDIYEA